MKNAVGPVAGFKPVTMRALPSYTWQALRLVPGIFIGVGGTLSAITWFQHRKERIRKAQEEAQGTAPAATEDSANEHKENPK